MCCFQLRRVWLQDWWESLGRSGNKMLPDLPISTFTALLWAMTGSPESPATSCWQTQCAENQIMLLHDAVFPLFVVQYSQWIAIPNKWLIFCSNALVKMEGFTGNILKPWSLSHLKSFEQNKRRMKITFADQQRKIETLLTSSPCQNGLLNCFCHFCGVEHGQRNLADQQVNVSCFVCFVFVSFMMTCNDLQYLSNGTSYLCLPYLYTVTEGVQWHRVSENDGRIGIHSWAEDIAVFFIFPLFPCSRLTASKECLHGGRPWELCWNTLALPRRNLEK